MKDALLPRLLSSLSTILHSSYTLLPKYIFIRNSSNSSILQQNLHALITNKLNFQNFYRVKLIFLLDIKKCFQIKVSTFRPVTLYVPTVTNLLVT